MSGSAGTPHPDVRRRHRTGVGLAAGDHSVGQWPGLAQFMDGTAQTVVEDYPELGAPQPYNPTWAIRALVRYDTWLTARVKGQDGCQKAAAALHSYNAGLGYTQKQQRASPAPLTWFEITEYVPPCSRPRTSSIPECIPDGGETGC